MIKTKRIFAPAWFKNGQMDWGSSWEEANEHLELFLASNPEVISLTPKTYPARGNSIAQMRRSNPGTGYIVVIRVASSDEAREQYVSEMGSTMSHRHECWKNQAYRDLGVGGDLASCTCGEDEMTHRHYWVPVYRVSPSKQVVAYCCAMDGNKQCTAYIDEDEIERRLNATECLSAEDAEEAAKGIFDWPIDKLFDYAKTLRGDDGNAS